MDEPLSSSGAERYTSELLDALVEREKVIADHAWRDRDADAHLQALIEVSERITRIGNEWMADMDVPIAPRLRHFLEGCSYQKARLWLEGESGSCSPR
ncbi:hypothetical protein [Sulfuriroseicoccus oceanibius]|uniref:Uncharacterized protein n=1 Tax=Sulfuriroseicoccus oceanibius TaxID=2707525 RepID=A0A6B3L9I9_9BACT|nr:hypothetical protein [Sulfuriroseicoccus oceanibius]QQL45130.1 hypothetical protein G3M56_000655 [Sulfuriroseicoccus oceanibius]